MFIFFNSNKDIILDLKENLVLFRYKIRNREMQKLRWNRAFDAAERRRTCKVSAMKLKSVYESL